MGWGLGLAALGIQPDDSRPARRSLIPWRSRDRWVFNGGHLEWVGAGRRRGGGSRIMHDAPFDAIRVGRGVSGMWGMRERPRPRRRAPIGASCRSRSRETAPGACIARQSSAFASAVPCYACQTCVARQGPAGSALLSSYACPARRDPFPGRPHLTQVPAVIRRAPRPSRTTAPPSGARRYPRRRDHQHPPSGARRYPPGASIGPAGSRPRPPGTDAGRNGPMDDSRSEAQNDQRPGTRGGSPSAARPMSP